MNTSIKRIAGDVVVGYATLLFKEGFVENVGMQFMKKVLITGAKGVMGSIMMNGLKGYSLTPLDLPDVDVRCYKRLPRLLHGHAIVLHFAWNTLTENWRSSTVDLDNVLMAANIYRAAIEAQVPRVLMASSVHADSFLEWNEKRLLSPQHYPTPQNPYGASKLFIEALGRHYAARSPLEVVCVRFAGMNRENKAPPREQELDRRRWLTHKDGIVLVRTIIDAPSVPTGFSVFYGVCNHPGRVHDYTNPFGWAPTENADDPLFKG